MLAELLNRNIDLLRELGAATAAGRRVDPSEPISIQSLSRQVSNFKWITTAAIAGSFIYLYATLVYIVWEGWRTIIRQRTELEVTNAELQDRIAEAKELQDRREAFVSIASHELRTPMTSIMGFSEFLLSDRDTSESTRRDWLTRIRQNGEILSALVDDMLDLSRIQTGKLTLNLEPVRLDNLVEETLSGIKTATDDHKFMVDVPSDTPDVWADREKLARVLMNLVTNAVKYSPDGGSVTISTVYRPEQTGIAVVQVADEGIGIAPDDLEQLFSSFYRIRRPETERIRGTGLGLSIVKGLVELMGGEVSAESELNKGSTFSFTIPTAPPDLDEGQTSGVQGYLGGTDEKESPTG